MPAYEHLAEQLRAQIESGELGEGARLPSEAALASASRVSRSTVREALRTLQEGGFVERKSPRILVVRRGPPDGVSREMARALQHSKATFRHLLEALFALEPELTRLAATRASDEDLAALAENLDSQEAHLEAFHEWNRLDEVFHLRIAESAGSPALATARTSITELLLTATRRFVTERSMTTAALRFHRQILAELDARDADGAAVMTRAHVNDFARAWERHGLGLDLVLGEVGGA